MVVWVKFFKNRKMKKGVLFRLVLIDQEIESYQKKIQELKQDRIRVIRQSCSQLWTIHCSPLDIVTRYEGLCRLSGPEAHTKGLFWNKQDAQKILQGISTSQGWKCKWSYQVIAVSMTDVSDYQLETEKISPSCIDEFPYDDIVY